MKLRISKAKLISANIITAIALSSALLHFIYGQSVYNFIYFGTLVLGVLIMGVARSILLKSIPLFSLILLFPAIFINLSNLIHGHNVSLFGSTTLFSGALLALVLAHKWHINLLPTAKFILLSFYLFLIFKGVTEGYTPNAANNYFPEASRNVVSANLIFLQIFHSGTYYIKHNSLPKYTPILSFLICVMLYGRSGIAISFGILVLSFLNHLVVFRKTSIQILLTSALGFSLIIAISISGFASIIIENSNFSESGIDSPRYNITKEYIKNIETKDLLLGQPYKNLPMIKAYNNNPHNSFIQGHHQMGAPYLAWLLLTLSVMIWTTIKHKESRWLLGLCALFMLRASLDNITLPGFYSFIFMYLYFYSIKNLQIKTPHQGT